MTNTPSPDEDRELIAKARNRINDAPMPTEHLIDELADRLESLISDRAKLARRVRRLANHGNCSCAECKELDALNRSTINNPQR